MNLNAIQFQGVGMRNFAWGTGRKVLSETTWQHGKVFHTPHRAQQPRHLQCLFRPHIPQLHYTSTFLIGGSAPPIPLSVPDYRSNAWFALMAKDSLFWLHGKMQFVELIPAMCRLPAINNKEHHPGISPHDHGCSFSFGTTWQDDHQCTLRPGDGFVCSAHRDHAVAREKEKAILLVDGSDWSLNHA